MYGIYPRDCRRVVIRNCVMQYCGSDGTVNRHDQSGTQAEQQAFWASSSTTNGGAARVRGCTEVQIHDNLVRYCLRGLRIADCGSDAVASTISNNTCYRTLEASIYLASSQYSGGAGCRSIHVVGNTVNESSNNGILVIGGQYNVIMSNSITRSANAGIQCWSVLDTRVQSNSLFDCNRLQFNGIGNSADAFGNIVFDGSTSIGTGTYIACCTGNSVLKANIGRAATVCGITLGDTIANPGYPAASAKIQIDANFTDATTKLFNPHSVAVTTEALDARVAAVEQNVAAITSNLVVENTGASASVEVKATTAASDSASIQIEIDSTANNLLDHAYQLHVGSSNSNDWQFRTRLADLSWLTAFRISPTGDVIFGAADNYNLAAFRIKGSAFFDSATTFAGPVILSSAVTMSGAVVVGGTNIVDALASIPAPNMTRNDVHMNPGGWTNWPLLPDDTTCLVHDTNSASRFRMCADPVDGQLIHVIACADSGTGTINLNTGIGARHWHSNSTGYASTMQVDLNSVGVNSWTIVYIEATNEWLLV